MYNNEWTVVSKKSKSKKSKPKQKKIYIEEIINPLDVFNLNDELIIPGHPKWYIGLWYDEMCKLEETTSK